MKKLVFFQILTAALVIIEMVRIVLGIAAPIRGKGAIEPRRCSSGARAGVFDERLGLSRRSDPLLEGGRYEPLDV
jgi:hypothetical protein